MDKISVVIITLNEERNIGRCIESVTKVADEVLVIDSLSTDNTRKIAESYGARLIEQPFLGHIEQKNFAKEKATHNWVLSLDADEALSEQLKLSILERKKNGLQVGYTMNRLTNYCGKWIKHSGWYPDVKLRLFRKEDGGWTGVNPHDRYELTSKSKISHLQGDLLHFSFYTMDEHRAQIEKFSDISSQAKFNKGIRSNWLKVLVKPVAKFLKSYVIKRGFQDGYYGWVIAINSAYATYLKYSKLLQLQQSK